MRIALILVIGIHGVIHLFGFLKAFGLSDFNGISLPITKPFGIVWLWAFVLLVVSGILLSLHSSYWWIVGMMGVILSQFLIINFWSDAKFGTIPNMVILSAVLLAYATYNFKRVISAETVKMVGSSQTIEDRILSEKMLSDLPAVVQKWLTNSGAIGKEIVNTVYLEQDLQMLMKPEQETWSQAKAKQYFTVNPPAFNWSVNLKMSPLIDVVGRDKFEEGQGEMIIKLFSLFPIVNAKNDERVDQATLQRYLAEIVWFPSAALSPYITWEVNDEFAATAIMEYNGTRGSGVFHFDEDGNFKRFVAMRYKDANDPEPKEWTVIATKTGERNGIKIPVESEAQWKLEDGSWTWLKLIITDIKYNILEM